MHTDSLVTVVVVPRERFSTGPQSLAQVLSLTSEYVPYIYVEGNPPRAVQSALHEVGGARVEFVESDKYLAPNQARNMGFSRVSTRYVAFLDNDVWVEPQWLDNLLACAEETNADVVGPIYRQGRPEDREVHMAGGCAHIEDRNGKRLVISSHDFQGKPLDEVLPKLSRSETELAEFHGVLVRSETLRRIGGLDEKLLATREHIDFCMSVREAGGKVMLEPTSQLTYTRPPPFKLYDLPYFTLRWSESWSRSTLDHFFEKWDLDRARIPHLLTWSKKQRYRFLEPWYSKTTRWVAKRIGQERAVNILRWTLYPIEGGINRAITAAMGLSKSLGGRKKTSA